MIIAMKKIGVILDSRPLGREAWLGMRPSIRPDPDEAVLVDFEGVNLLTPSFADEFLTCLLEAFPGRVQYLNVRPGSIVDRTIQFLTPEWSERSLV